MRLSGYLLLAVVVATALGCVANSGTGRGSVDQERAATQHIQLALRYIGSNNIDLARLHLHKAERFDFHTGRSRLYNAYALLYQIEGEVGLAEDYFRKAVSADKNDSVVRYNFAAFLYGQGQYKQALQQIQRVNEDLSYPRRAQALYILGLAQCQTDQFAVALESFAKANQVAPAFAAPYLEAAEIYFAQGKLPIAKRLLRQYGNLEAPSARSLWLGIRVDNGIGNSSAVARQGLQLENLFPNSSEAMEYQQWLTQ